MEMDDSIFGTDYSSQGGVSSSGDIELVSGLDNARQSIRNHILTEKGTYPSIDDAYGSEIYEVLGEDFEEQSIEALKIYIQNALMENTRVESIESITPYVTVDKRLVMNVRVILVNGQGAEFSLDINEE